MNKKIVFACCISLLFSPAALAQKSTVSGDISGLKDTWITFNYGSGESGVSDSVQVKNGKFKWSANMLEPHKIFIFFPDRYFEFFAEPGDIKITGNADAIQDLKVTGSSLQNEADAYEKSLQDIYDQELPLYQKWGKVSDEEQVALEKRAYELRMERRKRSNQYVTDHPESFYSLSLVAGRASMGEYNDVKMMYDLLSPKAKQTAAGMQLADRLSVLKRSAIGEDMLNFTQNDMDGQPVHFTDFKGKYVFVDFWASWCGPCRGENPNVLKVYNKYKDKNFTVIGVSLDEKGDDWKKAVKDDGMPWTQVSDLKGWKNEVSTYYGIQAIPSSLLVDPNGKIIAKDLRGVSLNEKLSELFD